MDEITVCYCMPLRSQIRNGIHHIGRVPRHYCIGHQIETAGLIGLIFGLMPPNVSLIGEKEKLPEGEQRFLGISVLEKPPGWLFDR